MTTPMTLVGRWIPSIGRIQVVITTCRRGVDSFGDPLNVEVFTIEESTAEDETPCRARIRLILACVVAGRVVGVRGGPSRGADVGEQAI